MKENDEIGKEEERKGKKGKGKIHLIPLPLLLFMIRFRQNIKTTREINTKQSYFEDHMEGSSTSRLLYSELVSY